MDCRHFRQSHSDFLDGLMAEGQTAEMYGHLQACARCARFDTAVRRGLLVVRNLPTIKPSPDFLPRLRARLNGPAEPARSQRYPRAVAGIAAAAAVVLTVILANGFLRPGQQTAVPAALAQATRPAVTMPVPRPASAQFLAGLASGVPVWPAVSIADRAAAHLEQVELQQPLATP